MNGRNLKAMSLNEVVKISIDIIKELEKQEKYKANDKKQRLLMNK